MVRPSFADVVVASYDGTAALVVLVELVETVGIAVVSVDPD